MSEADLRDFALGRCGDLEKLAWLEIEHSGDDVGGELLDLGVEVAYYSIVVAARILDRVFELRQRVLELRERFDGAQLWIGFSESKQVFQRAGQDPFRFTLCGGPLRGHGAATRVDDRFKRAFLMRRVTLHRLNDIGNQVVTPLELDVNVSPSVFTLHLQPYQPVVNADDEDEQHRNNDERYPHS